MVLRFRPALPMDHGTVLMERMGLEPTQTRLEDECPVQLGYRSRITKLTIY